MLSCRETAARASALIDGELGFWQTLGLRLHLAMCAGCDRFVRQLRISRDLAARAGRAEEAAGNGAEQARIDAIFARLREERQSGDRDPPAKDI